MITKGPKFLYTLLTVAGLFFISLQGVYAQDSQPTKKRIEVIVGGYVFEPFVQPDQSGLTSEIIKKLNTIQDDYTFTFKLIHARRRFDALNTGKVHMILYESPTFGWQAFMDDITISSNLLHVKEIYIARKDHPLGRKVFNNLKQKKLAIRLGYHYALLNNRTDSDYIKQNFKAQNFTKLINIVHAVQRGAADVGIVNSAFLWKLKTMDPTIGRDIMLGDDADSSYDLPVVLHKSSPIDVKALNKLLSQI